MELIPDEIVEFICRKLSTCDLKTMMLVDNYSRFIIENSPVLMEKLPLIVTDSETDEFCDEGTGKLIEPLMNSRRKVRKVIVELKREKIMKYLGIFQKFGNSITVLEIKNYTFETIDQLRIILRYLNKLKTLKLMNVTFQRAENKILNLIVQVPKLSLFELHNVVCVNSDPKIFSLFTTNQDIQLRAIRLHVCDARNFHYSDFVEMMNQQTRLKQFTLEGVTSDNCDIFNYDGLSINQLDNLTVENCNIRLRGHMRNLLQLIKSQRKLNVLKIINTPIPTTFDIMFTYRQIFAHNIIELHLDIRELTVFHSYRFVNETIEKLTIHGNFAFENLPVFINFIKMFPNVIRLKLIGESPIGDKYLFHILSTFQNLEALYVPGFTSRSADSNFSNLSSLDSKLQTLVLDYIDYDIKFFGWKNIVTNLKSIEKLIVKRDYGKVSNEIIDVIIKKLSLKHLELGIGVVSEKILHNIVYNNYCNQLKVLKIAKIDFEKIEDKFDFTQIFQKNHLLLYLCENEYFYPIKLNDKSN